MLVLDAIVHNFARNVVEGIRKNIQTRDVLGYGAMNNTGRAASSIGYRWHGGVLTFYSSWEHIWTLEYGRTGRKSNPGAKNPPVEPILTWVRQRGIGEEKERTSIAYLISKKIGENGTLLNVKYRATGVGSGLLTEFLNRKYILDTLSPDLETILVRQVTENLLQAA